MCSSDLLWLVGNRRSDTLDGVACVTASQLWLVGNRRSDTLLAWVNVLAASCGLWGIAARIHYIRDESEQNAAVACGESPLGYTT